jgi:hypothetical protein
MASTSYITTEGKQGRTRTTFRYIVIDSRFGDIIYRTDDLARAEARRDKENRPKQFGHNPKFEVVDTVAQRGADAVDKALRDSINEARLRNGMVALPEDADVNDAWFHRRATETLAEHNARVSA